MNNAPMNTFNRDVVAINRDLRQLETYDGPITGYDFIKQWNSSRRKISYQLRKLLLFALDMEIYESVAPTLYELHQRSEQLPYVPDIRDITRAKNLFALSPHIIVTEDVKAGEKEPPEMKRVTVANHQGTVLFDQDFLPSYAREGTLPSWNAPPAQALQSVPLGETWDNLISTLFGHYILAYDFALVQLQLEVTAERFQLPMPVLIGESILDLYFAYLGSDAPTIEASDPSGTFATIYHRIGAPFSREAPYTTADRAMRIAQVLQEIANGTLAFPL